MKGPTKIEIDTPKELKKKELVITISIKGPIKSGKSLLAHTIQHQLSEVGYQTKLVDDCATDSAVGKVSILESSGWKWPAITPSPNILITLERLQKSESDSIGREEVIEAMGDVWDWYQPDDQDNRPLKDILHDICEDITADRNFVLSVQRLLSQHQLK